MKLGSLKAIRLTEDANQSAQDFKVKAADFEGPFDLLLNLIDDGKYTLFDLSLTDITAAYLNFLKDNPQTTINSSAEFLILAAYLIEMKSQALLPAQASDEAVDEIESDLVNRIQEYRIFKDIAHTLRARKETFEKVRYRYNDDDVESERPIVLVDVDLRDLVSAFSDLWKEVSQKDDVHEIETEEVTLEVRIDEVRSIIRSNKEGVSFRKLFTRWTKVELVVTFIAILELARQRFLKIRQGGNFGDIILQEANLEQQTGN
jgi:segregation and condensation protein A